MTTMTNKKLTSPKGKTLLQVLGEVAYVEYQEMTEKNSMRISNVVTQRVEDKFERRLVEEAGKLREKISDVENRLSSKISEVESRLVWKLLAFIGTQTALIIGFMFFLHK